ncbi:mediator of RNA polymerase II transcription subunit 31 isoform X2 [Struthio camelus]|uniref:mediator of RNA polymerase II transcription subunit 31 isoform X2 n=1 Tax=Struthio camelus TaxID=8801 RepID=UPI003603DB74
MKMLSNTGPSIKPLGAPLAPGVHCSMRTSQRSLAYRTKTSYFCKRMAALYYIYNDTGNRLRFQLELEFVQCLANPNYLNFLAQRGYFKDKAFVNYLKYLLYWKEPEYAKYLKYPQCLHMLELLQYEHFRKELVNAQCAKFIDEQQILHWQHYSRKRMRLQQALAEQQQQNNTSVK